jgi:hypothetical protein
MILEFTAAKIAEIAFGGMIEGGAGKLTEIAIEKLNLLRQKIWNQLGVIRRQKEPLKPLSKARSQN